LRHHLARFRLNTFATITKVHLAFAQTIT